MMSLQSALLTFQESLCLDLNREVQDMSMITEAVEVMCAYLEDIILVVPEDHPLHGMDITYLTEEQVFKQLIKYYE